MINRVRCPRLRLLEQKTVRAPEYWKSHYVTSTDPAEIGLALRRASLHADDEGLELIYFLHTFDAPNILISQGSGGHGYVFMRAKESTPIAQKRLTGSQAASAGGIDPLLPRSMQAKWTT